MTQNQKPVFRQVPIQGISWMLFSLLFLACKEAPTPSHTRDTTKHSIGTKTYILEDSSRIDSDYGGNRLINIQVWYPADLVDGKTYSKASYYMGLEKAYTSLTHWSEAEYQQVASVESQAYLNAPILVSGGDTKPLILFSPSLGGNLSQYSYYAEYLSQRGYIVVGVNHRYESEFIIDHNGQIIPANHFFHDSLKTLDIPQQITADEYRLAKGPRQKILGEDLIFCLDQLNKNGRIGLKNQIDWQKIGVFGHSMGGAAGVYASLLDERFKAVLNIDGTPPSIAFEQGMQVPFMFIEDLVDYENHIGYGKLHQRRNSFCEKNSKDAFRIMFSETNHNSFLDIHYNLATTPEEKSTAFKVISQTAYFMESFFNAYLDGKTLDLVPEKLDTLEVHVF